jgi:hypothetical protein
VLNRVHAGRGGGPPAEDAGEAERAVDWLARAIAARPPDVDATGSAQAVAATRAQAALARRDDGVRERREGASAGTGSRALDTAVQRTF